MGEGTNDVQGRRRQLQQTLAGQWEWELRESPEFATTIGDYRYNDRWSDLSLAHVDRLQLDLAAWLARFEALDTAGLAEREMLDHRLMVRNLRERLEVIAFRDHEMAVDQLDGIHLELAQLPTLAPFESVQHYEDYVARLQAIPRLMDDLIEVLRQGARDRLVPPRYLLEKTVTQCLGIAGPAGEGNVFGRPVAAMPASMPRAEQARLRAAVIAEVDGTVRPAYVRLSAFIRNEYAAQGRAEPGIWSLPDGDARYRSCIRRLTTTDLGPDEIHELGLAEVARIEAEQTGIARGLGFASLEAFRRSLTTEVKLIPTSREQILSTYRRYVEQMSAALPKLFGRLPDTGLDVRSTQEYRENEAAAAEYYQGTPDGSRPGIFYVNTGDHENRSLLGAESTAYHEAVPGHHLQCSIAQRLQDLPPFRRHAYYGAYVEGWALYAERLGKDAGFYQDPYSDFGRLADELLRAVRLVVDTGVHHRRWTRVQMLEYFRMHTAGPEPDSQAEVDRYLVLPAQALTYKLGQLAILALRARAQEALGPRFDIRAFHDEILGGGPLPLDVLEERIRAWIQHEA